MKAINEKNRDEILFALLEGEIVGEERVGLLAEIAADPILQAEMDQWKKTIYSAEELADLAFITAMKRNPILIVGWIRPMLVAASILLLAWFGYWQLNSTQVATDKAPTVPVVVVPSNPNQENEAELNPPIQPVNPNNSSELPQEKKQVVQLDSSKLYPTNIQTDTNRYEFVENNKKTPSPTPPQLKASLQDSMVADEVRKLFAENRARGSDVRVTVENIVATNDDGEKRSEEKVRTFLANYEVAGFKRKYNIVKEPCDDQKFCYSLVITEGDQKTYIKL